MTYEHIDIPPGAERIEAVGGSRLIVPDRPIVPCIVGDGIGCDVTPAMRDVVDAAVTLAYDGDRSIAWMDVFAGEAAIDVYGAGQYLPSETMKALREFVVSIKGPLATPIGGGFRSLNVAIRQAMDLYACVRPVVYFPGISTTSTVSEDVDIVVFRENTEDIYTGIEWSADSDEAKRLIGILQDEMRVSQIRFPDTSSVGIKAISSEGTERLMRKAIEYAIQYNRKSIAIVHKGNIMKYTEGGFMKWAYELAAREFSAEPLDGGPWMSLPHPVTGDQIIIKDVIADNFLQQIILNPGQYDVVATPNLNGDYISDALAALVGGIGIAPGANIGDGYAVFEATHGTAPDIAGKGTANPGSLILSAEMMLRYIGWQEAAELILQGVSASLAERVMTWDLAVDRQAQRDSSSGTDSALVAGATLVDTRGFVDAVIERMRI